MREVTVYEAIDGEIFENKADCEAYENDEMIIKRINRDIGSSFDSYSLLTWIKGNIHLFTKSS